MTLLTEVILLFILCAHSVLVLFHVFTRFSVLFLCLNDVFISLMCSSFYLLRCMHSLSYGYIDKKEYSLSYHQARNVCIQMNLNTRALTNISERYAIYLLVIFILYFSSTRNSSITSGHTQTTRMTETQAFKLF